MISFHSIFTFKFDIFWKWSETFLKLWPITIFCGSKKWWENSKWILSPINTPYLFMVTRVFLMIIPRSFIIEWRAMRYSESIMEYLSKSLPLSSIFSMDIKHRRKTSSLDVDDNRVNIISFTAASHAIKSWRMSFLSFLLDSSWCSNESVPFEEKPGQDNKNSTCFWAAVFVSKLNFFAKSDARENASWPG